MSKKLWYDWKEMRRDVNTLCRDITLDKFDPQVIVGISRGGLLPGVMMSHWLQTSKSKFKRFSRMGRLSAKKDR
jgi:hypoxanthine phosphoribosyltransferase